MGEPAAHLSLEHRFAVGGGQSLAVDHADAAHAAVARTGDEVGQRIVRFLGVHAVQVESRPAPTSARAAACPRRHGRCPCPDIGLLVLELLSRLPGLRRRLLAVLGLRKQRIPLVGQRVARDGLRPRVIEPGPDWPAAVSARRRRRAPDRCRRRRAASRGRAWAGAVPTLVSRRVSVPPPARRARGIDERPEIGELRHRLRSTDSGRSAVLLPGTPRRRARHAAGTRRRDRLPIEVVDDVAGREHARHAGIGATPLTWMYCRRSARADRRRTSCSACGRSR